MTRRLLRSVLMAGAAAVLVAGCGAAEAGAAATVGDRRISVEDVQVATSQIQQLYGQEQPVAQGAVLFLLAAEPYLQRAATKVQAGASVDDARSVFGTKVADPAPASLQVIRANAVIGNLQRLGPEQASPVLKEVTDALVRDKFTVSPRYGSFDPEQGIRLDQPNWLPTPPAPSAPAEPAP